MEKRHRFYWIFCAAFSCLLMSGCSSCNTRYQAFQEGGYDNLISSRRRWEVQLPYKSGKDIVIERASENELLISEAQDQFHLTKIPLGKDGQPGSPMHLQVENGEAYEILDDNLILVTGKREDKAKSIALVNRENLSLRFSTKLPFSETTDFSIPGSTKSGDMIVLYESEVQLERIPWSDGKYQYKVPYVAGSKYDLHIINPANNNVVSFTGLDSGSIPILRETVPGCKQVIQTNLVSGISPGLGPDQKLINNYIYLLDQVFIVDKGRILIFSLGNLEGDKYYYSLNLMGGSGSPTLRLPSELAAMYPGELVATPRDPSKKDEKRQMRISGKDYRIERAAFLSNGLVVIAQEAAKDDVSSSPKVIMGIQPVQGTDARSFDRVWEYRPKYDGVINSLMQDTNGGIIYFPELDEDSSLFKVKGLVAANGKVVEGFPANFKEVKRENQKEKELSIVGTAVDFEKNLLYIHDLENNRLVCAGLR